MPVLPNAGGAFAPDEPVAQLNSYLLTEHNTNGTHRDIFDVKSTIFAGGARGDGTGDDRPAFEAARAAAEAVRGLVGVPPGFYNLSTNATGYCLNFDNFDYTGIIGLGNGRAFGSTLRCISSTFTGLISVGAANSTLRTGTRISNLCLQAGDGTNAYGSGFLGSGIDARVTSCLFDHLSLQFFGGAYFIGLRAPGASSCFDNVLNDIYMYLPGSDNTDGLYMSGDSGSLTDCECILVKFDGNKRQSVTPGGGQNAFNINGNNTAGLQFLLCHPYFSRLYGYRLNAAQHVNILGGQCETNSGGGMDLIGAINTNIGNLLFYNNTGGDIVVEQQSTRFNIHDNLWLSAAAGTTRNIYVAGTSSVLTSSHGIIHHNILRTAGASSPVANIQLDTGADRIKVLGNQYDFKLQETGTTTGTRNNVFAGWNDGPASSITKVDTSTTIGADNTQV